jgi:phosphoribosylformylglycinamidine synthase
MAEMAIAGSLGVRVDLGNLPNVGNIVRLFSESTSRFIVEVTPEHWEAFEEHMHTSGVGDVKHIGNVTDTGYFEIYDHDELIYLPVTELQKAWKGGQA